MNELVELSHLSAWRLLDAGRAKEALEHCANAPGLSALIAQIGRQAKRELDDAAIPGPIAGAVKGWRHYYVAEYADALVSWDSVYPAGCSWLDAWMAIGYGKVATDNGLWGQALGWAGVATAHAREGEHYDHLAAACGTRGEALLRAGMPLEAVEAFGEDLALLLPGSRYAGRVRCYRAHAWARLGERGRSAAEIAYRLSAHSPHERSDPYAWAGLALLSACRHEKRSVAQIAAHYPQESMPGAWIEIAGVFSNVLAAETALPHAAEAFGEAYRWERRWLHRWAAALDVCLADPPELCRHDHIAMRNWADAAVGPSTFDMPVAPDDVPEGGFVNMTWPTDAASLWECRKMFMP